MNSIDSEFKRVDHINAKFFGLICFSIIPKNRITIPKLKTVSMKKRQRNRLFSINYICFGHKLTWLGKSDLKCLVDSEKTYNALHGFSKINKKNLYHRQI
ncbi:hypothetical protein BpHYR1_049978 [Brachionus plicatilis]|uniref:Uncharacterized protein n=1 Tax=Brachionus plicatilis TaxID=10195 RepID=A0A3M7Q1V9_BRAPC|nr:hypothetical protein BpHYR1_049978 [Brachionus plicatilis]